MFFISIVLIAIQIILLLFPIKSSLLLTKTPDSHIYPNLTPCRINTANCFHYDKDLYIDGYLIPRNEKLSEGYLVDIDNINQPCSGVRRIMIVDGKKIAICDCSSSEFIQKNILSDCNIPSINDVEVPFMQLDKDPEWITNFPYLLKINGDEIDPSVCQLFKNANTRHIINPCNIDALTGAVIFESEAKLVKSDVYGVPIYFCHSMNLSIATIKFNSDYLKHNNGRFANAVVRIGHQTIPNPLYDEIQEWYIQGGSYPSIIENGSFTAPIIGSKIKYPMSNINPKLLGIIKSFSSKNAKSKIQISNDFIVYSFPLPKDTLPNSMIMYNVNDYNEYNNYIGFPTKYETMNYTRYSTITETIPIKPIKCSDLLSIGIKPIILDTEIGTEIPKSDYDKLIKGGISIGCINNMNEMKQTTDDINIMITKQLFHKLLYNKYIINPLNHNNTNVIIIDHEEKTIKPIWLGEEGDEKNISYINISPFD